MGAGTLFEVRGRMSPSPEDTQQLLRGPQDEVVDILALLLLWALGSLEFGCYMLNSGISTIV